MAVVAAGSCDISRADASSWSKAEAKEKAKAKVLSYNGDHASARMAITCRHDAM